MKLRQVTVAVLLLASVAAVAVGVDWYVAIPPDAPRHYVGRNSCVQCHAEQGKLFASSHHDLAMDLATQETVLGNFEDAELTHFGVTSRFHRDGEQFVVTTEGPDGELHDYPVKYTFGVEPLQQYLVEFPGGRMQCLPLAWDTEQQRWFHVYPDEHIAPEDALHWSGPAQNWNYMCAECHSTNLERNFDLSSAAYHTTFSEIDVSCESCHGPGSLHVQLAEANSLFWDRNHGFGLAKLKGDSSKAQLDTCAKCHSRRRNIYPGHTAGADFLDHYDLELISEETYHADGQILDEDYVYGSFIQSLMYHKGVRCTDCHDPHSTKLLAEGNALCNRCHTPAKYDTPAHHFHPQGTKGASCVECHMPETTYMVVDPRRDHSLRIPRPDLTVELGIPNACNGCHEDESPQWAEEHVRRWYGPQQRPRHFAHAIAGGRKRDPAAEQELAKLAGDARRSGMVRASATTLLRDYQDSSSLKAVQEALRDEEALVRAAAVRTSAERIPPERLARQVAPLLTDPIRLVRQEAARVLSAADRSGLSAEEQSHYEQALQEYIRGQESLNDQPAAHLNLGVIQENLGDSAAAEMAYRRAISLQDNFVPARINLAVLLHAQGRAAEAEALFRQAIDLQPELGVAHYSLGLLLGEQQRVSEAIAALKQAVQLEPENSRWRYNLMIALWQSQELHAAEEQLQEILSQSPGEAEYWRSATIFYLQQGRLKEALQHARQLVQLPTSDIRQRAADQALLARVEAAIRQAATSAPASPANVGPSLPGND